MGRTLLKNGGTAIFCKNHLFNKVKNVSFVEEFFQEKVFEGCAVEITCENTKLIILSVYRSPSGDLQSFFDKLDDILIRLCNYRNAKIILTGDLNIDSTPENNKFNSLSDILGCYGLRNHIDGYTRIRDTSASSIDYVCSNFNTEEVLKCEISHNALSDHSAQIAEFIIRHTNINTPEYRRSFSQNNINSFIYNISKENWHHVYNSVSVETGFSLFIETLKYYIDISFPLRLSYSNTNNSGKRWITKGIRISSEKIKILSYDLKINFSPQKEFYFKKYKQIYKKVIAEAKKLSNVNFYKNSQNKSKAAWQIINNNVHNKTKTKKKIQNIIKDNIIISEPCKIADHFNDYFINIPEKLRNELSDNIIPKELPYNLHYHTLFLDPINEMELGNIIKELKNSYSAGIDGITTNILKLSIEHNISPLVCLINRMFEEAVFPDVLKIAKIIPVFKKGNQEEIENYRPISLLSIISKIVERSIFNRIIRFLVKHKILHNSQHGFMRGKSTATAIYRFLDTLYENVDNNLKTVGIFMDLSKAFDLVDHKLLLSKLNAYGLRGKINELLESYLTNRYQFVEINGHYSDRKPVLTGVPQGSVLGPLLFILFMNDLPKIAQEQSLTMFADDTTYICSKESKLELLIEVEGVMEKFINWFSANKLFLNVNKTVFMHFTPRQKVYTESLLIRNNRKSITQMDTVKLLGIHIENNLGWKEHIDSICSKLTSTCYAIYRLRNITSTHVQITYYYAYFYSRITYGIAFWGRSHHCVRIFRLQKKCLRTIANVPHRTHCRNIFKAYKILPLPCIYMMEILLFVEKNISEFETNNYNHEYNTRQCAQLRIPSHQLTTVENNPRYIGVLLYNKLPPDIKYCRNFKRAVKEFLLLNCFYSIEEYLSF